MDKGTVVYLCWYDFATKREDVYQGEVVDNGLWADTKWADWVTVRFTPRGLTKPICHHFREEQLSLDGQNVPHDDCYLVCGQKQKKQEPQRESMMEFGAVSLENFKRLRWNHERNHLQTDSLEEFYRLWHDAIAAKFGYSETTQGYSPITVPYSSKPAEAMQRQRRIVSDEKMKELKQQLKEIAKPRKLTIREKRSTGRLEYQDAIQTSIFD